MIRTLLVIVVLTLVGIPTSVYAQFDVEGTIAVHDGAVSIAVTPDGSTAYVVTSAGVDVVDVASRQLTTTIPTGGDAYNVGMSPDGNEAWVSNRFSGMVSIIDTGTDEVVGSIALPGALDMVRFTPDGTRAYVVTDEVDGLIETHVIDVESRQRIDTIASSFGQEGIVIDPDGLLGYLGMYTAYSPVGIATLVFDVTTSDGFAVIPNTWLGAIRADGDEGWGTDPYANRVARIDLQTRAISALLDVPPRPTVPVFVLGESRLVVPSDDGQVSVIDTGRAAIVDTVGIGSQATSAVVLPDDQTVLVAGLEGRVTILGLAPPLTISIDVKPGSYPNCFKLDDHGSIPIALLGSAALDVSRVDVASLRFEGLEVRVRGDHPMCATAYANSDAYLDLVCHFEDDDGWTGGSTTGVLTGTLLSGRPISGTDSICLK